MEKLKKFNTKEEYQEWKDSDDYSYPNVCKVADEIVYNDYPEPFWIEALEDIRVWQGFIEGSSANGGSSSDPHSSYWKKSETYMTYSSDKVNWTSLTKDYSSWAIIKTGEKLYFQSTYKPTTSYNNIGTFYITGKCNIGGSILSLIHGADYLTERSTFPEGYVFSGLFRAGHLGVEYNKIINAKDLILPEYTTYSCYSGLFRGCKDLLTAPRLPAKTVASQCYMNMFVDCVSLTKAPSLLALAHKGEYTYGSMFSGCSSLSYIKMMSLSPLSGGTYGSNTGWVKGVSPTGIYIANYKGGLSAYRGDDYIPEGWNVYLYDEDNDRYVVKFSVNSIPYEYYTDEPKDITWNEFINSEYNTNGFTAQQEDGATAKTIKFGDNYVLLSGNKVLITDKVILNASYTIGQPTATTELTETTNEEE